MIARAVLVFGEVAWQELDGHDAGSRGQTHRGRAPSSHMLRLGLFRRRVRSH